MAAKQGLSAQISQASEDAKRAVLSRTTLSNSLWFSNLNTTCTIKSAPPRTPDVLSLLSTKSGWLFKRNEQHVWQARYCCVVPHTFLYYFDAHPSKPSQTPTLTPKQQEELNHAIKEGYGKRGASKQHQPRSSLYHVLGGVGGNPHQEKDSEKEETLVDQAQSTLQPAGIIDLECYTSVHRNQQNQLLMELAGDETVNPDLRSFYFCANNTHEGEEWNQALLSNRHSSLVDEKEAYQQVCDGFAQQLQVLHTDLEQAQSQAETQQEELYRVRSQMEDTRRSCVRLVADTLERADDTVPAKRAYRTDLETIQAQDFGILAAVQLLSDYTRVLEETCRDNEKGRRELEEKLETKQEGDSTRVQELEDEIKELKTQMEEKENSMQSQIETVTQKYIQSKKELQDVQKDLASQRMETTMYQSQTRTKLGELQSHKKILKKEVIDLRKKLEEANSQLDLFKHKETSVKMEAEQERQKAKLLERYVEKMESQVKVQQNMMEMMSAAGSQYGGGGSIYGDNASFHNMDLAIPGSSGPSGTTASRGGYDSPNVRREYANVIVNSPSLARPEVEKDTESTADEDIEDDRPREMYTMEAEPPKPRRTSSFRRNGAIDDDAKSHMSELTEDRTQRHFDAALYIHQQQQKENSAQHRLAGASPRNMQHHALMGGPPSIIIGGVSEERSQEGPKLDTIMSTHSSTRPRGEVSRYNDVAPPKPQTPRRERDSDSNSVSSIGSRSKMSIAQRSRLEADRQSTPVRVRVNASRENNSTPLRGGASLSRKDSATRLTAGALSLNHQNTGASSNRSLSSTSFLANFGQKLEKAIDSTILGIGPTASDDDASYGSTDVGTDVNTDIGTDVNTDVSGPGDDQRRPSGRIHEEEKKTGDTDSIVSGVSSYQFKFQQVGFPPCHHLTSPFFPRLRPCPWLSDRHFSDSSN